LPRLGGAHAAEPRTDARRRALRAIAFFEAAKGLAALAAGVGLLELLHHDIHRLAVALLWRFHLDPALPYPTLLLHYADLLSAINLRTLAPVALAYIAVRFVEAWGLWKGKNLGRMAGRAVGRACTSRWRWPTWRTGPVPSMPACCWSMSWWSVFWHSSSGCAEAMAVTPPPRP
jgi:hypothetical protein